jgi:hypothetical protein
MPNTKYLTDKVAQIASGEAAVGRGSGTRPAARAFRPFHATDMAKWAKDQSDEELQLALKDLTAELTDRATRPRVVGR